MSKRPPKIKSKDHFCNVNIFNRHVRGEKSLHYNLPRTYSHNCRFLEKAQLSNIFALCYRKAIVISHIYWLLLADSVTATTARYVAFFEVAKFCQLFYHDHGKIPILWIYIIWINTRLKYRKKRKSSPEIVCTCGCNALAAIVTLSNIIIAANAIDY